MAGGAVVLAVALWGGRAWWNSEDANYGRNLFKPLHAATRISADGRGQVLRFTIDDSAWLDRRWTPLIPDHGKLMHLFLIRDDASAFAHLHPVAKTRTPSTPRCRRSRPAATACTPTSCTRAGSPRRWSTPSQSRPRTRRGAHPIRTTPGGRAVGHQT